MADGNFDKLLLEAVVCNKIETVRSLLQRESYVGHTDANGNTPLHLAVKNGRFEIFKVLLKHSPDHIDEKNKYGRAALHYAARDNETRMASELLHYGADVNVKDDRGQTPLHYATLCSVNDDHFDLVKILVEHRADLNVRDPDGMAPLTLLLNGPSNEETAGLLLDSGAIIDLRNHKGTTALHLAVHKNYVDMVRLLVSRGADISIVSGYGHRPLHYSALYSENDSHLEIAEILLERCTDVDCRDEFGNTAFHFLIVNKKVNDGLVNLLLEHGADPFAANTMGLTPLHFAAKNNNLSMVEYLLEIGAEADVRNGCQWSPLQCAAFFSENNSHLRVIRVLLKHGAEVNARDADGDTPLHLLIRDKRANCEVIRELLDNGADVDIKNKIGLTAIHLASKNENVTMIEYLLSRAVSINTAGNQSSFIIADKSSLIKCIYGKIKMIIEKFWNYASSPEILYENLALAIIIFSINLLSFICFFIIVYYNGPLEFTSLPARYCD